MHAYTKSMLVFLYLLIWSCDTKIPLIGVNSESINVSNGGYIRYIILYVLI